MPCRFCSGFQIPQSEKKLTVADNVPHFRVMVKAAVLIGSQKGDGYAQSTRSFSVKIIQASALTSETPVDRNGSAGYKIGSGACQKDGDTSEIAGRSPATGGRAAQNIVM